MWIHKCGPSHFLLKSFVTTRSPTARPAVVESSAVARRLVGRRCLQSVRVFPVLSWRMGQAHPVFFFLELPLMTSLLKTLASLSHGALVSLWWKKIISHLKNSLRNILSFSFEIRWEPSYCLQWLSTCVIEDEFLPYLTDSSCQQHC